MRHDFRSWTGLLIATLIGLDAMSGKNLSAQQTSPTAAQSISADAQQGVAPAANPVPPPAAPAKRSQADLEKLVAPIALYPDQLLASVLPASAYPLEIVQAARFVKDTNNIAKLDEQPWDDNVKAVARFPDVISQMDQNIAWTSDLGDAFVNQSKDVMDAVQTMRAKAQESGALKTTPQQTVTVTNTIVTNIVEQQAVYVTNQVVEIQPSQPDVIYVPQYSPTVVYAGYPVYPGYVYPTPYYPGAVAAASIVSFGAGMAMGAWMGNGCNWGHGDIDVDVNHHYNSDINRDVNRNTDRTRNTSNNRTANRNSGGGQKWQPNQNRRSASAPSSAAQNRQARGYGSGTGQAGNRVSTGAAGTRASATGAGNRMQGANAGTRTSGGTRPSTASAGTRSSGGAGSAANRAGGGSLSSTGSRSGTAQSRPSSASRSGSAFSGGSAASARSSSARGAASRSGGFSGGARGGGGGFRGGGGRGGGRR